MFADLKRRICFDIFDNRVQYLLLFFFLVVGITAGTFTVSHMQPGEKTALSGYIDQLFTAIRSDHLDYFITAIHSFLQNTFLFGIITMFSLVMIGIPLIAIVMILKGFCVGFAIGVLSINFGFGGFAAILFCIFIPNLILIPCICKAGVLGLNNSITVLKSRKIPNTAKDRLISSKPHFSNLLRVYFFSLLGVLLETFMTPMLIKLI